jgi:hypothetical protein
MGNINFCSYRKLTYYFGGDEMRTFITEKRPSLIFKEMINKTLLQEASKIEIFHLRGMLSVFLIQGFITYKSYFRFERLIEKARKKELKLNTNEDKK